MRYLKVAGAALNQTPMDWKGNRARILEAIRLARREQARVLCLPELCISGYGCEDAFHGESVAEQSLESLRLILPETQGLAVAVGLPFIHQGKLFNVAAMLVDGRLAGLAAKKVLAGYGVYYEPRWFSPWPAGSADTAHANGEETPIGDLAFDLEGVRLGFEICEDAWGGGAGRGGGAPGAGGAAGTEGDIFLNPSASHFAFEKYSTLKGIVAEGSRLSQGVYIYSNLVGNEAGRLIFDGAVLVASGGRMVAEGRRFSFREVNLASAIVDLRANRLERRRLNYPATAGTGQGPLTVGVPFRLKEPGQEAVRAFRALPASPGGELRPGPGGAQAPPAGQGEEPPAGDLSRNEEFARAVGLGLWDYLRKSRSKGLAVSLSGGVDSSTVAVLGWTMVRLALAELGREGFSKALGHVEGLADPISQGAPEGSGSRINFDGAALVGRLLMTVYQATENSSQTTRAAARGLAEALGARHLELEVGGLVAAYEKMVEQALGQKLSWEEHDIARQNIQARVRSPGIWLLANLEGFLLLSTSNRSEVGVGYATMDGDTSGGLAPIAGANKTFLRGWLKWMESEGLPGLGPVAALEAVNRQEPTAELRPLAQGQLDEDDLMPYPVLDAIEQAAIRDRMTPVEVWRTLLTAPPLAGGSALEERQAADYVARFFRLWSASQWKRERLAPSFHLDDENLDPRTWCRFPILSSGYETELEELARAVEGSHA